MKLSEKGFSMLLCMMLLSGCGSTNDFDLPEEQPGQNGGNGQENGPDVKVEICNNNIDDDENGHVDCDDPACQFEKHCKIDVIENCTNNIDDDGNGHIDCDDPACVKDAACRKSNKEICDNGVDDDGDGLKDCDDPVCSKHSTCYVPGKTDPVEICDNEMDDDDNGLIDCDDPACAEESSCLPADGDPIEREVDGFFVLPLTQKPYTTLNRAYRPTIGTQRYTVEEVKKLISNRDLWVTETNKYDMYGLGIERVEGEPWQERYTLVTGRPTHQENAKSLAWFWQISDPQLVDMQSPCRMEGVTVWPYVVASAYRPQDMYSAQMMDVHIQTGKRISDMSHRPFDFVLVTGDVADNAQYNEQKWFHTMMKGGVMNPDSGEDDDPIPGPNNDFADPFYSPGIGNIPWYIAIGNHDLLYMGFSPTDDKIREACVADHVTNLFDYISNAFPFIAEHEYRKGYQNGFRDASLPNAPVVTDLNVKTPADPDRRVLSKAEMLQLYYDAPGMPVGHGLDPEIMATGWAYYWTYPIPGKPIRLITLDTNSGQFSEANMTKEQLDWVETQLKDAQAKHEIVIVQSHHGTYSGEMAGGVSASQFRTLLATYPNVVAHITGHGHNNDSHANKDNYYYDNGVQKIRGYWEVMLASIIDFPSQTRLFELVWEGGDALSIYITNVDANAPVGSFVYDAMKMASTRLFFGTKDDPVQYWDNDKAHRNLILHVSLPHDVAENLANYEWSDQIESLTTLKNMKFEDAR